MRILILTFAFILTLVGVQAQEMDSEKLLEIIQRESDTVRVQGNTYQFIINESLLGTFPVNGS